MKSLDFNVRVADRLLQAQLLAGTADKSVYRPGEEVSLEWEVQPYRRALERMSYSFRLPENLPDGDYELLVSDASQRERWRGGATQVANECSISKVWFVC